MEKLVETVSERRGHAMIVYISECQMRYYLKHNYKTHKYDDKNNFLNINDILVSYDLHLYSSSISYNVKDYSKVHKALIEGKYSFGDNHDEFIIEQTISKNGGPVVSGKIECVYGVPYIFSDESGNECVKESSRGYPIYYLKSNGSREELKELLECCKCCISGIANLDKEFDFYTDMLVLNLKDIDSCFDRDRISLDDYKLTKEKDLLNFNNCQKRVRILIEEKRARDEFPSMFRGLLNYINLIMP